MSFPTRRVFRTLLASGAIALGLAASAAADRDATLRALDALVASDDGAELMIRVNEGTNSAIAIGDRVEYRLRSGIDGYLTVIHVDPNGVLTVMQPSHALSDNRVRAGVEKVLPDPESGIAIEAEPPVGLEVVYAIASETPLDKQRLGLGNADPATIDVGDAPAFVERLTRTLRELAGRVVASKTEQRILGREAVQYSAADIENYFRGARTRSLTRPKLDLQIQFPSGSHQLDETAKRNLDEFGTALKRSSLASRRFVLSGHTDDVGDEDFNLELSKARAETARKYLMSKHGIDVGRIEVEAYGESKPKEPNQDDFTRRQNRRVEFTLEP